MTQVLQTFGKWDAYAKAASSLSICSCMCAIGVYLIKQPECKVDAHITSLYLAPGSNVSTNTYNVKIGSTAYIYQFQSVQNIGGTVSIYACDPQVPPVINSARTFNLRYVGAGLISLGILIVICAFAMAALVSQSPTAATLAGGYDAMQFL